MSLLGASPGRGSPARRLMLALLAGLTAGCSRPAPVAVAVSGAPQAGTHALAFSPDGKTLVTWDWENLVELRDVATGAVRSSFPGGGAPPLCVALSPDGHWLATGH